MKAGLEEACLHQNKKYHHSEELSEVMSPEA